MTGRQFEQALAKLGLTKRGSANRLFHCDERSMRKWSNTQPPPAIALCLALMLEFGITPVQAEAIAMKTLGPRS